MEYITTKNQCQKRINEKNYVCDHCGEKIVPLRTVDNAGSPTYWAGCMHGTNSGHFTIGVPVWIYKLAYRLVLDDSFDFGIKKGCVKNFQYNFELAVRNNCQRIKEIEYIKNNKPRKTKHQLRKEYSKKWQMGFGEWFERP